MPMCPTCFAKYPDDVQRCSADDAALVPDATFAHVDRDIPPGTTVGEYTIETKLGEGGFGAVYSAVHPLIGKRAAVKILSREFSSNPQMVSRFIAEARAVNQIRHRNIIDIFSFGQLKDGRQYYIMELLEGVTFDAYLAKKKRLDLVDALPIFRGIARALDAAHAKGILHRDLKPENVFLVAQDDGTFEPKLLDFGLVKLLDASKAKSDGEGSSHNTKTGTPMGTPYYMSPEQCRGLEVDTRTDVYSFGALAFETLTGDVPFNGASTLDILMQHMSSPPPSASAHCPEVPAALDGPLAQIMAKEPSARPSRVGEAVDSLARAAGITIDSQRIVQLASSSITAAERAVAPTIMAPEPVRAAQTFLASETSVAPPAERKRSRLPILAAAAALVVGGLVVVLALDHHTTRPTPLVQIVSTSPPAATSTIAEPKSAEVEIRIDGVPEGTTVTADDRVLSIGARPFKVKRGAPTKLELSAKGFHPKELTITPDENMLLSVTMEKEAAPAITPVATGAKHPPPAGSKLHSDLETF